jgi:hypothetical protein
MRILGSYIVLDFGIILSLMGLQPITHDLIGSFLSAIHQSAFAQTPSNATADSGSSENESTSKKQQIMPIEY